MEKEVKLKNCPCCDSEPKLVEGLVYCMIKCTKCGLNIFDKNERVESLKKKWNKRYIEKE